MLPTKLAFALLGVPLGAWVARAPDIAYAKTSQCVQSANEASCGACTPSGTIPTGCTFVISGSDDCRAGQFTCEDCCITVQATITGTASNPASSVRIDNLTDDTDSEDNTGPIFATSLNIGLECNLPPAAGTTKCAQITANWGGTPAVTVVKCLRVNCDPCEPDPE